MLGNQSHILFTIAALAELVAGYVWLSNGLPHHTLDTKAHCYQINDSHSAPRQRWLSGLILCERLWRCHFKYWQSEHKLSSFQGRSTGAPCHLLDACSILFFFFFLLMRPLKPRSCLPSVISKKFHSLPERAEAHTAGKLQPRTWQQLHAQSRKSETHSADCFEAKAQ